MTRTGEQTCNKSCHIHASHRDNYLRLGIQISKHNSVYFKSKEMDISTCMENSTLHHSSKTFKFVTKRRARELMPYMLLVALVQRKVIFRLGLVFRQPIMFMNSQCVKVFLCNGYGVLPRGCVLFFEISCCDEILDLL